MKVAFDRDAGRRICPCCASGNTRYQRQMRGWQISECEQCGSAFSELMPSSKDVSKIYEKLYEADGLFEHHRKEVSRVRADLANGRRAKVGWERKRFFKRARALPASRLLDIGCGTGLFLVAASQAGWSVQGVEVSRQAAELGRAVHELPVHIGMIEELRLPDESFDVVTAWEVLEHVYEPREFLRWVFRVLKPGGVFAG